MASILLLVALAGMAAVVHWLLRNDGAQRIADQTGLLRMTPPPGEEPSPRASVQPQRPTAKTSPSPSKGRGSPSPVRRHAARRPADMRGDGQPPRRSS